MDSYSFSRFNTCIDEGDSVLLYNSLVGSLSILEKDEYQLLKDVVENGKTDLTEEQFSLLDRCKINNFVVYSDIDEMSVI